MSKEGIPLSNFDAKPAIQKHQESAEWPFRDEAKFWYSIAGEMDRRFFNGLVYPDGKKVPTPVIAFDDLRNKNTLACYDLFPDEIGITGKITFNTAWYEEHEGKMEWVRGKYSQGETLVHEYVHLWQQIGRGLDPYKQGKHGRVTHNKEFVAKCEELGIHPKLVSGVHTQIATEGSPIDILLKDMGIPRPDKADEKPENDFSDWAKWLIILDDHKKIRKGRSTLTKYTCPTCKLNVRIGIKDDPELLHIPCGTVLVKDDGKVRNIYIAK